MLTQLLRKRTDQLKVPAFKYPVALRQGSTDTQAFYQAVIEGEYNIEFKEEPRVIIDGGANIGLFSLLMKNKFPAAMVICIEPDRGNFNQLQKNVSRYDNVFFENSGLWYKEAKLKVWDKFGDGDWAMVVEENDEDWNVNATSITTLMKKYDIDIIDVLKLDVEASEKELFAENYEYWLTRTKMLIVELHDGMKEGCSKQFFEAINKTFLHYDTSISGENIIVVNRALAKPDKL